MVKESRALVVATILWAMVSLIPATHALDAREPAVVVNHRSKECAFLHTGDEWEICSPTEGWHVLEGAESLEDCPTGYSELEQWAPGDCVLSPFSVQHYSIILVGSILAALVLVIVGVMLRRRFVKK